MNRRARAWLDFGGFCVIFVALFNIQRHFRSLDHWMGLIWLCFLIGLGVYALFKVNSTTHLGMPTFFGALPKSWQRWILGESDEQKR